MKHFKKVFDIVNKKRNFETLQKGLTIIEKILKKYNLKFDTFILNEIDIFSKNNKYLYTLGIGDFDNLTLYVKE